MNNYKKRRSSYLSDGDAEADVVFYGFLHQDIGCDEAGVSSKLAVATLEVCHDLRASIVEYEPCRIQPYYFIHFFHN